VCCIRARIDETRAYLESLERHYSATEARPRLRRPAVLEASCISLTSSCGEIVGGKPTWGRSYPKRVSVTNTPNELMRRYVLRWQTETSGDTFSHFGQHVLGVSLKNRLRRHLANHCRVKRHSLAPNISPLLPESDPVSSLPGAWAPYSCATPS